MTTKITDKNISNLANAGVSWQSVIVADGSTGTTGVAGRGYFINTTSAAHTFTLPATATFADTILIKDYAGTFATNALTIARNGHNIQGAANNSEIGTNRASVTLVYVDVTRGWEFVNESNVADLGQALFITATGGTVTTSGDFKIHSFTGDGCFVVATIGNSPTVPTGGPSNVDYLVVAGGGGTASGDRNGGGGAGGHRTTFPSPGCNAGSFPISSITYPITVGGGGNNSQGSSSTFSTITSAGGGPQSTPGGSGGGGYSPSSGGNGNTPPVSPPQGNPGGPSNSVAPNYGAGGGGGASTAGSSGSPTAGGAGGNGLSNSITGSPVTRAGGGGGGTYYGGTPGSGGPGGGGAGAPSGGGGAGGCGSVNTGSGGGGGSASSPPGIAGLGGSGIVIIRYKFQ